jgi:hypothetical protein
MSGRTAAVSLGTLIVLALSATAQGQGSSRPALEVTWTAPDACPDHDALVREIARLLGHPPDSSAHRSIAASARISRSGSRWRAQLEIATGGRVGHRTVEARECSQAMSAVALVLALAIDPAAVSTQAGRSAAPVTPTPTPTLAPTPSPTPSPLPAPSLAPLSPPALAPGMPPPPVVTPRPSLPQRPARAVSPPRLVQGFVRYAVVMDAGTLPGVALGSSLAGGVIVRGLIRVEVGIHGWPDQSVALPNRDDLRANLSLYSGDVRVCAAWAFWRFEGGPCVAAAIGVVTGEGQGQGLSRRAVESGWVLTTLLGGAVQWNILPIVALRLGLDVGFTPAAPSFAIEPAEQVGWSYRAFPVVFRGSLGLEARFR